MSSSSTRTDRRDASILHADLDAFYASVEQRDDPSLRGRPVIVGGGVVLAASYEAKAFGVRTAMGGRQAKLLCPDAVIVPCRFEAYTQASKDVFAIFEDTTPVVEGISIDEAFLDVGGLRRIAGSPVEIASKLRQRVRDEVGLAITVGIARTKFLAKVASGVGKPDGLLEVPPDGELEFLHPLPVQKLWGVGTKTAEKLHARGLFTVGEVAALDQSALVAMLGAGSGRQLHALAHNRDLRRVTQRKRRGSIGSQCALGTRLRSRRQLDEILMGIVERITRRMRKAECVGRTVVLRLRFDDFTRATRSHTLAQATAHTGAILHHARALLDEAQPLIAEKGLTLLGLSIANLSDETPLQLALPFGPGDGPALDATLDSLRERFGATSVQRAALLGKHTGVSVPLLPD